MLKLRVLPTKEARELSLLSINGMPLKRDNNTVKQHTEKIRQILSFIPYAEILFISAKSGQRLNKIFELIDVVIENNSMRVATGVLNEIVTEAVAMQQPPTDKGKRLKIYYVTQVSG